MRDADAIHQFAYALVAKRLKEKDVVDFDLSCIRIAGCGAEPIQAKTLRDFPLGEIVPYVDWSPFFMAWELSGKYPQVLEDKVVG